MDLRLGELRKNGTRIRLQEQPFQVLAMLLERPGELITRDELRRRLWPADTFVDFDHGLNAAINRLRERLSDSADSPRYIETVPRRGYRFIAPVEVPSAQPVESPAAAVVRRRSLWWGIAAAFAVLLAVSTLLWVRLPARPEAAVRSLAVLPLQNLSGDAQQEYFSDGMTDELITELAKIGALRVVSRTSVMHYKGTQKTLPQIARELNVDGVVEGSVVRSGERVRITAQLIDARTDRHLWSESYDRSLKDVLALQSEVAGDIAEGVRVRLTPEEAGRLAVRKTVNPEAYDSYLRGRFTWNERTDASLRNAAEYFRRAIALDPAYAPAYSGLADVLITRIHYQFDAPGDVLPETRIAAHKAVELDPASAEAHNSLASLYIDDSDWQDVEPEFRRAIALNPGYAVAHHWYSDYLSALGRHQEAIAEEKLALRLDPLSPIINTWMGRRYYQARRYQEAYDAVQTALQLDPGFEPALAHLGMICVPLQRYAEATAALNRAIESSGGGLFYRSELAYVLAAEGKRDAAKQLLDPILRQDKQRYLPSYMIAEVYAALGDRPRALRWLNRAFDEHSDWIMYVRIDPALDPLRREPEFAQLVRKVGLPPR